MQQALYIPGVGCFIFVPLHVLHICHLGIFLRIAPFFLSHSRAPCREYFRHRGRKSERYGGGGGRKADRENLHNNKWKRCQLQRLFRRLPTHTRDAHKYSPPAARLTRLEHMIVAFSAAPKVPGSIPTPPSMDSSRGLRLLYRNMPIFRGAHWSTHIVTAIFAGESTDR